MTDSTKGPLIFLRFEIRGRPRNLKGEEGEEATVQSGVIDKGQKKIGGLRAKVKSRLKFISRNGDETLRW